MQTILVEQQRIIEDIKKRHAEESEKLSLKIENEIYVQNSNELQEFKVKKEKALREAMSKQAAELNARNDLSSEEIQKVLTFLCSSLVLELNFFWSDFHCCG